MPRATRALQRNPHSDQRMRSHTEREALMQEYAATQENKIRIRRKPAGALREFSKTGCLADALVASAINARFRAPRGLR